MNVKDIHKKCSRYISNSDIIKRAKSLGPKYLGILWNTEAIDDIFRARKFTRPSSFYGHRYGKSKCVLTDHRPDSGMDMYITDDLGILMNDVDSENMNHRIENAKKKGDAVIFLFGGSTMAGMGARMPEFTIPSLLEKMLKYKYGVDTVCVNFGIGGTMSTESLGVLINEALDYCPDSIIFYDGWNCCSYLTGSESIRMNNTLNEGQIPYSGVGIRQFEHDITLYHQYDFRNSFWKGTCLLINRVSISIVLIFENIFKIEGKSFLRKLVTFILSKFFSIRPSNRLSNLLPDVENKSKDEIDSTAKIAVNKYIKIHDIANIICKSKDIRFFHFLQPLLLWGNCKILTNSELEWKNSGFSSGNPKVFTAFYKQLQYEMNDNKKYFYDLSGVFAGIKDELFIDSGHLNRKGNCIIAEKIADIIQEVGFYENN